jgi:hypothetical protein
MVAGLLGMKPRCSALAELLPAFCNAKDCPFDPVLCCAVLSLCELCWHLQSTKSCCTRAHLALAAACSLCSQWLSPSLQVGVPVAGQQGVVPAAAGMLLGRAPCEQEALSTLQEGEAYGKPKPTKEKVKLDLGTGPKLSKVRGVLVAGIIRAKDSKRLQAKPLLVRFTAPFSGYTPMGQWPGLNPHEHYLP